MAKGKSQNQQILDYMKSGHSITPIEALNKFGCFRLSARIADLKELGYTIHTEMVHDKKPDGTHEKYAKYMLIQL